MGERMIAAFACIVLLAIVYEATHSLPEPVAPKPAPRFYAPKAEPSAAPAPRMTAPLAPMAPPSPPPPMMASTLGELYHDEDSLRKHLEYLRPQQAIAIEDKLLRPGFGPAIRFHRNPDGSLSR